MRLDISKFENGLLRLIKDKIKSEALTVADFKKIIETNIEFHKSFISATQSFSTMELNTLRSKIFSKISTDKTGYIKIYQDLTKMYLGKAKTLEVGQFIGALMQANRTMINVLMQINSNIDQLFEDQFISISNCKISNMMILGIMRQSHILGQYTTFIWTGLAQAISDADVDVKPYRIEFLVKHTDHVTSVINSLCAKDKTYSFLKDIELLKQKNMDSLLYANGSIFTKWFSPSKIPDELNTLGFSLPSLNFIAYVIKRIDDYQYTRYLEWKDTHEWLIRYSQILKMDLASMDKNSPEYKKLEKSIEIYDEKIVEYNRKIEKYLHED